MGVIIYATNSDCKFSLSYSGFGYIRMRIADRFDSEFGKLYEELFQILSIDICEMPFKLKMEKSTEYMNKLSKIATDKNLDCDVVEFLLAPDYVGAANYKTCRTLATVLSGEIKDRFPFNWEQFKEFLMECYSHRRCMRWR